MGVYSNLAVQKVNEQTALENFRFSDLLEFAIDIEKSDQAMFDAMLEMDFHEAYESKGIITLTEADKLEGAKAAVKGIAGKIVELLGKFLGLLKTFGEKIFNIFAELAKRNKPLAEKLGSVNAETVVKAVEGKDVEFEVYAGAADINKTFADYIGKISDIANEAVDGADYKEIAGKVDGLKSELDGKIDKQFKTVKVADYATSANISALKNALENPSKDLETLKPAFNKVESDISGIIKDFEAAKAAEKDTEGREKYSNIITGLNTCLSGASKILSMVKSYYSRKASTERAVAAKICSLAGKKVEEKPEDAQKEDKTEESSMIDYTFMSIDVMNETYIEQLFA